MSRSCFYNGGTRISSQPILKSRNLTNKNINRAFRGTFINKVGGAIQKKKTFNLENFVIIQKYINVSIFIKYKSFSKNFLEKFSWKLKFYSNVIKYFTLKKSQKQKKTIGSLFVSCRPELKNLVCSYGSPIKLFLKTQEISKKIPITFENYKIINSIIKNIQGLSVAVLQKSFQKSRIRLNVFSDLLQYAEIHA